MATKPPTLVTPTNEKKNSVVDDKLRPTSKLELLVGGPYEGHVYGHTALRVKTSKMECIYDFGRYRNVYREEIGLGVVLSGADSPRGEGILRVWSNFNTYIAEENALNRTTWGYLYFVFDHQAEAVISFFFWFNEWIETD